MHPVTVRDMKIGEGIPIICVPIVGITENEIMEQVSQLERVPVDMVEWRADWYESVFDLDKVKAMLLMLREKLGDKPLLFTFRTRKEGGEKDISVDIYRNLNLEAAKTGLADLVDVEIYATEDARDLIQKLQNEGVQVIGSSHNFKETPSEEAMIQSLQYIQDQGADILKLAVMPNTYDDVIALVNATKKMTEEYAHKPVVTMSMSQMGMVTRLIGEFTGSAITFGAAGKTSAPGQIPAKDVKHFLRLLHRDDNIEL